MKGEAAEAEAKAKRSRAETEKEIKRVPNFMTIATSLV